MESIYIYIYKAYYYKSTPGLFRISVFIDRRENGHRASFSRFPQLSTPRRSSESNVCMRTQCVYTMTTNALT